MPAMGSQIATELAAGQTAVSDVYIGAESYLVPLVNRKIFQPVEWQKLLPGRITNPMVEGDGQSLRVFSGLPGTPYNKTRVPKNRSAENPQRFFETVLERQDRLDALRHRLESARGQRAVGPRRARSITSSSSPSRSPA